MLLIPLTIFLFAIILVTAPISVNALDDINPAVAPVEINAIYDDAMGPRSVTIPCFASETLVKPKIATVKLLFSGKRLILSSYEDDLQKNASSVWTVANGHRRLVHALGEPGQTVNITASTFDLIEENNGYYACMISTPEHHYRTMWLMNVVRHREATTLSAASPTATNKASTTEASGVTVKSQNKEKTVGATLQPPIELTALMPGTADREKSEENSLSFGNGVMLGIAALMLVILVAVIVSVVLMKLKCHLKSNLWSLSTARYSKTVTNDPDSQEINKLTNESCELA